MQTLTIPEFHAVLRDQGVSSREHLAFKCPMCGTIQSAADLIKAGAGKQFEDVEKFLAFSCVGRFTGAKYHNDVKPGDGCDWTLGGLFKTHKLEIIDTEGERHPRFQLATPEEARAHESAQAEAA